MRILAAVLVLAVSCVGQTTGRRKAAAKAPAPQDAPARDGWPLLSLKITGNHLYTEQQIAALAGLKVGRTVTKGDFEAARVRLTDSGAFESVGFQFGPTSDSKGYTGSFEVVEVEQLYPFRFEALPEADKQLRALLAQREPLFHDKIPGTKRVIDRFAAELQDHLGTGFNDKVTGQLVADKPGELTIVFRPATSPPVVAEVQFTGCKVLPASKLQGTFSAVAIGVAYRESTIRQLLDTSIRPVYDGRGRLKVSFPKIEVEKAKDVDGLRVTIQVDEGPVYNFGTLQSAVPIVPPKKVLKLATFKTGDVANFDAVSKVIDGVQKELRKEGYMRCRTQAERVVHDKEKTVDVTFTSTLGPRFLMGKLSIEGLDITSEPAMRKIWGMVPGNPYNADYPQFFLDQVKAEGYFDNLRTTRWDQDINEKTHTVDVTLYFKGGVDPEIEKRKKRERENPQTQGGGDPPIWE
jgi:outer membrane protein insertion porin family